MTMSYNLTNRLAVGLADNIAAAELITLLGTMSTVDLSALTSTATELNQIHSVTAGTVVASKALVVDSNKDLASLRDLTVRKIKIGDSANDNVITISAAGDEGADRTLSVPALGGNCTFAILEVVNAFSGRVTTTDGVTSGTARVVGGLAYSNTAASAAITATATETLFSTQYSIPANTLKAGTLVKIRFQGIATATNSSDTLAIKLYIGGLSGTLLLTVAATDATNNDVFTGEYELIIRTAGLTGTVVGVGTFKSIPAAEGTMTIKDDILASTTIDTTAAQVVGVSATWSSTNGGNSCRLDFLRVEIY